LELNQNQTLGDGSKTLGQIMTPVQDPDYDSNSLKRSEFFFSIFKKGGQKLLQKVGLKNRKLNLETLHLL
jgi:hypothetical protein